ncbi:MAG: site-specific integrase [Pyrinomonadaceae bacterium]|nr:site-specific integrase [Pyrinomonadaceae bacterium]
MSKVFLREKKISKGRKSLYLDFYPPIVNPDTRRPTRREHLKLYIYDRPKTEIQKEHNKESKMLGESIRSQRQLDIQSGYYGFLSSRHSNINFVNFFDAFAETKRETTSKSNYDSYVSISRYLRSFAGDNCTCGDVDEAFCRDFSDFLLRQESISNNTAAAYFDKFKYVVKEAFLQKLIKENPAENIRSIKLVDTKREFLSLDELRKLAETPFRYEDLRRASLFSALTGLRYSDIEKLTWKEIQKSDNNNYFIRFRQKKTGDNETLPLSADALEQIGPRGSENDRVFENLKYHQTKFISDWVEAAGINRKITFHSFRHTFATLQLSLGTDIYTVSKLLGHKNLQTTQVYARVIDERKQQAVDRIKLS